MKVSTAILNMWIFGVKIKPIPKPHTTIRIPASFYKNKCKFAIAKSMTAL